MHVENGLLADISMLSRSMSSVTTLLLERYVLYKNILNTHLLRI